MRRILLLFALMLLLSISVCAEDMLDTDPVEELPPQAQELMPQMNPRAQSDLWDKVQELLFSALGKTGRSFRAGLRLCGILLSAATLCAVAGGTAPEKFSAAASVAGALAMCAALMGTVNGMVQLAGETMQELADYNACMLPVLASAAATSGGFTRAGALYGGTMLFSQLLLSLIAKLLIPLVYFYLALAAAEAAIGTDMLGELRELAGWVISKSLRIVLYGFLAYMSITGVISGATDASVVKAAKATISGMVPVVGGIISDASESLLAGAALLRGSVGVYGMVAILAIALVPFLRLGVQYLMMKLTAAVSGAVAMKSHVKLLENFSSAMGYLLAMCGTSGLLLLVSCVCLIQGVSG